MSLFYDTPDKLNIDSSIMSADEIIDKYQAQIECIEHDYISSLEFPEMIYSSTDCFSGLINMINRRLFLGQNTNDVFYRSIFTVHDTITLDNLFHVYCGLCAKYGHIATLIRFCSMVGMNFTKVSDFLASADCGEYKELRELLKTWYQSNEQGLYDRVAEKNSIGSMFIMKSKFNYRESAQELQISVNHIPQLSKTDLLSLDDGQE